MTFMLKDSSGKHMIRADQVFMMLGGELPIAFLERSAVRIQTYHGEVYFPAI